MNFEPIHIVLLGLRPSKLKIEFFFYHCGDPECPTMHVLHIEYTNNDCISFTLCLSYSLLLNITFVAVVFGTVRTATSVWILSLLDFLPSQYCSVYHIPTRPTISELVVFVRRLIASSIALWYRSRLTSANFHQEWK